MGKEKKQKKEKKEKKDKKDKKEKKSRFTDKETVDNLFSGKKRDREEDAAPEEKKPKYYEVPEINPWSGEKYTPHFHKILETRKKLPAWEAQGKLSELVTENQVIVLQGETGSGKTTQVP